MKQETYPEKYKVGRKFKVPWSNYKYGRVAEHTKAGNAIVYLVPKGGGRTREVIKAWVLDFFEWVEE